jgi:TonB dependent receptor-like, beta-barrel/TonB-dependent Receptor Plug Domain
VSFPRRLGKSRAILLGSVASLVLLTLPSFAQEPPPVAEPVAEEPPEVVVITARRTELIGVALTSSEGIILREELLQLPTLRPGQLLEAVPGLVVTIHSGEGKANQYLLRGVNLDHGTDLATFVDGMPVNMRTHAHGQGYTDLNFFIPELASGITYSKGPYFAQEGDFASVAAVHMAYVNEIPDQASATIGTLSYQRLFTAGTRELTNGRVLGALELVHYDGPWIPAENTRKLNGVIRYSEGEASEGWSLTAMYYRGLWNATTDQPERAVEMGLIDRFGTLDPTDAGRAQRMSVSGVYSHGTLDWHVDVNAYAVNNHLTLWNNFTHDLDDPINGDQHAQNDVRGIFGGSASYSRYDAAVFGAHTEFVVGVQTRYDDIHVNRIHTAQRTPLDTEVEDWVKEFSAGAYGQVTTFWNDKVRSVLGVREDYLEARDKGSNAGDASTTLFQPKGSLIFSPWAHFEFYASAGRGFHSNDVRGSTTIGAPLIVQSTGKEIGMRATPITNLTATLTLFQLEFESELTYDAEAGQTEAGRPSKRTGVEFNATYEPFPWLELYGTLTFARARYTDDDPAGNHIPDSPNVIGFLGAFVRDAGPWSGALEFRYIGAHPLIEDDSIRSEPHVSWNMNIGYDFGSGWTTQLGIFNLFNSEQNAAEYYYVDRLPGEPPEGVADIHVHPIEPRSFRFTLSKSF